MTTEKGKHNKKWASSQEYRDNFERIFAKPEASAPQERPPAPVQETCPQCQSTFWTMPLGWRACWNCAHKWVKLEEVKP